MGPQATVWSSLSEGWGSRTLLGAPYVYPRALGRDGYAESPRSDGGGSWVSHSTGLLGDLEPPQEMHKAGEYTVEEIAVFLWVSRKTVYRHLDPATVP